MLLRLRLCLQMVLKLIWSSGSCPLRRLPWSWSRVSILLLIGWRMEGRLLEGWIGVVPGGWWWRKLMVKWRRRLRPAIVPCPIFLRRWTRSTTSSSPSSGHLLRRLEESLPPSAAPAILGEIEFLRGILPLVTSSYGVAIFGLEGSIVPEGSPNPDETFLAYLTNPSSIVAAGWRGIGDEPQLAKPFLNDAIVILRHGSLMSTTSVPDPRLRTVASTVLASRPSACPRSVDPRTRGMRSRSPGWGMSWRESSLSDGGGWRAPSAPWQRRRRR